jgi:hypothetical protein
MSSVLERTSKAEETHHVVSEHQMKYSRVPCVRLVCVLFCDGARVAWPRKQRWGPVWSASGLVGVVVETVVPEVVHEVVERVQKHPLL